VATGKNKYVRKLIAGQLRTVSRHQKKIEEELVKLSPNVEYLRKWEREIDAARTKMRQLEKRLEK
jgi:hypothetical protein